MVVHEAALSGCCLALSEGIGSADDFAAKENAVRFSPWSITSLSRAMVRLMAMDDGALVQAQAKSIELARNFGIGCFTQAVQRIVC